MLSALTWKIGALIVLAKSEAYIPLLPFAGTVVNPI
jgi:hypothetical protein